jgi:parvulin-like peptidyl-prolyl isomerase
MTGRNNVLWIGAVFILILSVVTFVYVPTSRRTFGGHSNITFGEWDGKPIEYVQDSFFVRQIQAISAQMEQQGQQVNQFSSFQIMKQAFDSTVIRFAILDDLKKVGYKVPESFVNKALVSYYLDENGKYSNKIFNDTPETTRALHRTTTSEEMTVTRFVEDMFGDKSGVYGLKAGSKEIELIKTMSGPQRSFDYVSFSTDSYPVTEVVAYGQANAKLFAKHDLSVITVDTEAAAKKVADSLAKKTISFDDAITTYSTKAGADSTGKLLKSLRYNLNELFTDAKDLETVLALKPGDVSPIVKAGKEFVIVRCNAAPVDADFNNSDAVSSVSTYMIIHEKGKIEDYFVAKAKEFAATARTSGLPAASKAAGLEVKSTAPFGVNYGNVSILTPIPVQANPELSAAPKSETFFKTAFSLAPDAISDPIVLGNDVVVLKVKEEKAADTQISEMLPLFYNYYAGSWSQETYAGTVLKDKRLKDDFMNTYLKYFLPKS